MDPNQQFQKNYEQLVDQKNQGLKRQNIVIVILAILLLITIAGLGAYVFINNYLAKNQPKPTINLPPREEPIKLDPNQVDTSGWTKEICSQTTELCFKVPPNWSFNQDPQQETAPTQQQHQPIELINFLNNQGKIAWTLNIYEADSKIRDCPTDDQKTNYYTTEIRRLKSNLNPELNQDQDQIPEIEQIIVYPNTATDRYKLSTYIDPIQLPGENVNTSVQLSRCWMENGPEAFIYNNKLIDATHNATFESLDSAKQAADSDEIKNIYGIMTTVRNLHGNQQNDNRQPNVKIPYAPK